MKLLKAKLVRVKLFSVKSIRAVLFGLVLAMGSVSSMQALAAGAEPALQVMPDVNINTASAAELSEALKGVGVSRANAIVIYREKNGLFKSADELANVKGVGAATIKRNKGHIKLK